MRIALAIFLAALASISSAVDVAPPGRIPLDLEVEWSGLSAAQAVEGSFELTEGVIDSVAIVEGSGRAELKEWQALPSKDGAVRIRLGLRVLELTNQLRQVSNSVPLQPAILTARSSAGSFSFFPTDLAHGQRIILKEPRVLVAWAGDTRTYVAEAGQLKRAGGLTQLQSLAREPEWDASIASHHFKAPARSDVVLGLDRNWESFWMAPLGERIAIEERDTREHEPNYDPFARLTDNQRHFMVGPALERRRKDGTFMNPSGSNVVRSLESGYLPMLRVGYDAGDLHYDVTGFAGTLDTVLDLSSAANEPELAVFYEARVSNRGDRNQPAHFQLLQGDDRLMIPEIWKKEVHHVSEVDPSGRLRSDEIAGKFQAAGWLDRPASVLSNGFWSVDVPSGQSAVFRVILPYSPVSAETLEQARQIDFQRKKSETAEYWNRRLDSWAQVEVPDRILNDSYKSALVHFLLRVYPGRFQAEAPQPFYQYTPRAPDFGVWNGRFCPIASESMPMIHNFDAWGFETDFVRACLQYYYNRQWDDGRLQVIYYDIETPWVLWGSLEHLRMTQDVEWAKSIAPQVSRAAGWITMQRQKSYRLPPGAYGRGLFAGHTADDAPKGGGYNFMFNGYMYMGLQAAGDFLKSVGSPEAAAVLKDAEMYRRDIEATLEEAAKRAPVVRLGDGYWRPAIPPQHNLRGLGNWDGFFSHGAYYLHDAELGPLHLVYAGVLDPFSRRVSEMLEVLSAVVLKEDGITESQPAYSKHPYALLERGDVNNFLRAFYALRFFQSDRETGTWWEHRAEILGSPHKTHEEAWWLEQFRWMLLLDGENDLKIFAGIPRRWIAPGKSIRVEGVRTRFGRLSVRAVMDSGDGEPLPPSGAGSGTALSSPVPSGGRTTVHLQIKRESSGAIPFPAPDRLLVRVPESEGRRIRSVTVNGKRWTDFDPVAETITLPGDFRDLHIRVVFGKARAAVPR